jgi:MATE family multidrug resistance protein
MSAIIGAMAGLVALHCLGLRPREIGIADILERVALLRTLLMSGDFMIRSVALLFAFAFFTAQSARQGDVILAANSLLFHIFSVGAFTLDGFAAASETLCGQALGARDRRAFHRAVILSLIWANASALVLVVLAWPLASPFLALLTTSVEVRHAAMPYLPWAIATFVFGATAFVFDGVYGGATWSGPARNVMVLALAGYLAVFYTSVPFGNDGLWWALLAFLAIRSLGLWLLYPRLRIAAFGSES